MERLFVGRNNSQCAERKIKLTLNTRNSS